jgi:WD40-like Beta Propeller Repeat
MSDMADLERHVGDWLRVQAPPRAPASLLTTALDRVAVIPQERRIVQRLLGDRLGPSRTLRFALVVALLVAALVAALLLIGGSKPPFQGWIAFRNGTTVVAVDPTDPTRQRVMGESLAADPIAWATNGRRLLLAAHPDEVPFWQDGMWWIGMGLPDSDLGLFVLEADGSRTRLADGISPPAGVWGSFSPDGSMVAYACCGSAPGPYVVDVHGGEPRSLLGEACRPPGCGEPLPEWAAWSPISSEIAYLDFWEDHPKFGHHALVLSFVNADGTGLREGVLDLPGEAGGLVWSPDGSRLAFWMVAAAQQTVPAQVYVVNADGSGLRELTHEGDNRWPTWSPDGSRIAFARGQLSAVTGGDGSQMEYVRPGSRQLLTMASDGKDVTLIEGVHPAGPVVWIPAD